MHNDAGLSGNGIIENEITYECGSCIITIDYKVNNFFDIFFFFIQKITKSSYVGEFTSLHPF